MALSKEFREHQKALDERLKALRPKEVKVEVIVKKIIPEKTAEQKKADYYRYHKPNSHEWFRTLWS